MAYIPTCFHTILRNENGVALIEFAIVFPVILLLLFGGVEVNRLILIQQKHEKAGYALADIITQYKTASGAGAADEISEPLLTQNVLPQFLRIMQPYGDETRQAVIVTSIEKTADGDKTIRWQVAGGGTLSGCDDFPEPTCVTSIVNGRSPSAISAAVAGMAATFSPAADDAIDAYSVSGSTNIIVTEAFYRYQPIMQDVLQAVPAAGRDFSGFDYFLQPKIFVKRTYFLPRNGDLYSLPPSFPIP